MRTNLRTAMVSHVHSMAYFASYVECILPPLLLMHTQCGTELLHVCISITALFDCCIHRFAHSLVFIMLVCWSDVVEWKSAQH